MSRLLLALLLAGPAYAQATTGLAPASSFNRIAENEKRAVAVFQEAGKVIMHPRCLNCHPADDTPRQSDLMQVHEPPVDRGDGGIGASGMRCFTCHGAANFERVPGSPRWFLAPKEMAWMGKSLGQICEQIKDRKRNGDKSLEQIVEHMAHDELVGWAWHPGLGRTAVPGTQQEFGALIRAWADSGAQCPQP